MNVEITKSNGESIMLTPYKMEETKNGNPVYELLDGDNNQAMTLVMSDNKLSVEFIAPEIEDVEDTLDVLLDELYLKIIEAEQSGVELESNRTEDFEPFNPEDIKVHAKQFSLRLISDMIDENDIDLSPDFQRNLVWNSFQKSRLIESVLLRIPLPMFYFSEDNEGRITIVDGLQRLTTIKEFMDNKFALKNLEYLGDSCEGRYFDDEGSKKGLDTKYKRWFNQTQFSVNVIDPSSPSKVKYDIFRRINTGGKPLNNQEIRNCLAGSALRFTLKQMTSLEEFQTATDYSIKSHRMEDHEVALRFILFSRIDANEYSGYMDASLDELTESLVSASNEDLAQYISHFSRAMQNAEYLFGNKFAFRKVRTKDIQPNSNKKLINKALFTAWSVLLSKYEPERIKELNGSQALLEPLAQKIENDENFFNYLSYGTNGKINLIYSFETCTNIIEANLKY
jgi:Protein of unknown function DUF262